MLFCVKTPINKLYVFGMALLLAVTLAGCGGSGGGTATTPPDPPVTPEPTPQEQCEDAGGRWNADLTCTSAEDLAAERMAMVAAATKAAATKAQAMNAQATGTVVPPFDDSNNPDDNYTVTAAHEDGAVAVKITVPGAAEDDPAFTRAESLPVIDGWDGSMHSLGPNDDGETEIVGVYTDIAAPKPTAFATVYPLDVSTNTDNDSPAVTNEALTISSTSGAIGNHAKLASPRFSASGVATLTFPARVDDNAATTDVDETAPAFETMATFDGAPGTLRCNGGSGTTCTVTLDADGKITNVGAGWAFTPAEGAMVGVPDADYLYYGFWLKKTDKDGATTYNAVQTFAGGVGIDLFPVVDGITLVAGTARYEGGAAGVYVRNVYKPDGAIDSATSGTFTAAVGLTAYFGGNDVAVNKQYSIEGSVSDFALSGGEQNAWSANLKANFESTEVEFSGTSNGGGDEAAWNAAFYGAAVNTPDEEDADAKLAPAAVAGEFNAHFSNGSVAGAFGAHRQ